MLFASPMSSMHQCRHSFYARHSPNESIMWHLAEKCSAKDSGTRFGRLTARGSKAPIALGHR